MRPTARWPVVVAVLGVTPYIALKTAWLLGLPVGVHDQGIVSSPTFVVANLLTLALDLSLLYVVRALLGRTHRTGIRGLLCVTSWTGIGLLVGAVAAAVPGLVVVVLSGSWPVASSGLEPWVYLVVYSGFAIQAAALVAAWSVSGFAEARSRPSSGHARTAVPAATLAFSVALVLLVYATVVPGAAGHPWGAVERSGLAVDAVILITAAAGAWRVATWPPASEVWRPLWWITFASTGAASTWGAYEASLAWAGLAGGTDLAVVHSVRTVAAIWLTWVVSGTVEVAH